MVFRERTYSVLLVSAAEKFNQTTLALLPPTDYHPVTVAGSAGEARRAMNGMQFDLVLVNAPLPDEFGSHFAEDVCARGGAGVLLFVRAELYDDVCARVTDSGVMVLSKPTSTQTVTQALRMLCAARERLRRMEEKQATVDEKIREIRLVNRAKWLLIECLGMTEADAHRYIEKQSMDLRQTRREAAENIIKTYS